MIAKLGEMRSAVSAGKATPDQRKEFEQQIIEIAPTMFAQVATHVKQHLSQSEKLPQHDTVAIK